MLFVRRRRVIEGQEGFLPMNEIMKNFWPNLQDRLFGGQPVERLCLSAYAEYFRQQWSLVVADADGRHVVIWKVEDVFQIVERLVNGDHRDSIILQLKQKNPSAAESACESSIDLAVRLLLMLKVGTVRHQTTPRHCLKWENGSLQGFIRERFNKSPVLDCHHVRLPKSFNAWSIATIGGLKIEFTDNLADHLRLVEDDTIILIFHHASFLECQVKSVHTSTAYLNDHSDYRSTLYPSDLIDETIRTLAILFPQSDFSSSARAKQKRDWLQKLCLDASPCLIDPRVALCGNLRAEDRQIERFTFWRDRLIILKQVYDDAKPRTMQQWWYDRRNGERWFTFWVAVLVLVITITLGLIQCIESALQVYKAYYPTVI